MRKITFNFAGMKFELSKFGKLHLNLTLTPKWIKKQDVS